MSWEITVTSDGAITGTCNGSEALEGSISGDNIKVRRACPGYDPPYQDYVGIWLSGKFKGVFRGAGVDPGTSYDWSMKLP